MVYFRLKLSTIPKFVKALKTSNIEYRITPNLSIAVFSDNAKAALVAYNNPDTTTGSTPKNAD